ncbi:MAG: prepilin-type N-terminal cleavage/methylation domain-containing protein [Armatimonadota bacterium]|jgi:prepilin-type N-terminal cleavage/methylation domain-containing protein
MRPVSVDNLPWRHCAKMAGASPCPTRTCARGPVRRSPGEGGFTLIELLIALVVLMIGIYGMLRVFPSGYSAVEATQQQTTAAQLADGELARWKLDPESLPDAIVATDYSGKVIPATLTDSMQNIPQYLTYYPSISQAIPGTSGYTRLMVGDTELKMLGQTAPPFIYSPTDTTPSIFDTVLQPPASSTLSGLNLLVAHPNWQPNSVYLPRTVIGERIDIRSLPQMMIGAATQQSRIGVPFYLLSHAPCDALRYEPNPATALLANAPQLPVYFDVYDARQWQYRDPLTLASDATANTAAREFSISGSQLLVAAAAQLRMFRVDYTDLTTRARVIGATVTVNRFQTSGAFPVATAAPDPATVLVYERMIPLSQSDYQTMLNNNVFTETYWPRNAYYVNAASTVSGQIQFAPVLQSDPQPTDVAVAKVDYRVYDWQILVFDIEVPSVPVETVLLNKQVKDLTAAEQARLAVQGSALAGAYVQLPVRNLKSVGYTNPPRQPRPQPVAVGVRAFYDNNGNPAPHPDPVAWGADRRSWAYIVAVDRQSGQILTDNELSETGGWPANPWMRSTRLNVDYKEGLLYFNYSPTAVYGYNPSVDSANRGGRTYRVFCRAQNDWAVQLMAASRLYARSDSRTPSGNPVALAGTVSSLLTYSWTTDQVDKKELYFPLSESGQTVAVDYYYAGLRDPITGVQPQIFVSGEVHTIGPLHIMTQSDFSPAATSVADQWVCALSEPLGGSDATKFPNAWGPTSVRGVSVRARSTWVTTGRAATLQKMIQRAYERGASGTDLTHQLTGVTPDLQETWHQVIISTYLTRAPI